MTGCPVCGATMKPFLDPFDAPVYCNVLWPTAEAARRAPRAEIELALCPGCGLIRNTRFDERLVTYAGGYENALHFSALFREYETELADRLVRTHALHGKRIVEIGSGDGHFLALLCERGGNRGYGYDPSGPRRREHVGGGEYTLEPELYEPGHGTPPADLVCARHVLEHLADPLGFLRALRATGDAALYLEVPDAAYMLREAAIWDVIYEHCSYFASESLTALLTRAGYAVSAVRTSFGGQYLAVEAAPDGMAAECSPETGTAAELALLASTFDERRRSAIVNWQRDLGELRDAGRSVALWGAGSKGVMFACAVQPAAEVAVAVDLNERKHGRHLPVTAIPVVPPTALRASQPDDVVAMNANYEREIAGQLAELAPQARLWVA